MNRPDSRGPDRDRLVPVNARFLSLEKIGGELQQSSVWQTAHFGLRSWAPTNRKIAIGVYRPPADGSGACARVVILSV